MKALITAAVFTLIAGTAQAGWIATPNMKDGYCEAHPENRTINFGVIAFPADKGTVGLLTVFGRGEKANTPAAIEFGPHQFGPFPIGHYGAWGSSVIMSAFGRAEDEALSILVHMGEESSWFVMQGFKKAIKQCVELILHGKEA